MPELASVRGAGLGNELFPWAKALIGAAELGLTAVHPAWALNPRGYRGDFGTSRWDWLAQRSLRAALPVIRVTAEDVLMAGAGDYADLMRSLAPKIGSGRRPVVLLHASGMVGGFRAIRAAKPALQALLLAPRHVPHDLYAVESTRRPDKLQVAIHVRAGEGFGEGPPAPGEFNRRLPTSWYAGVVDSIAASFGENRVEVALVGDRVPVALEEHVARRCTVLPLPSRRRPLLSDLFTLASADLLVCSVSSFSLAAAFLGDAPYIWYGPHLSKVAGRRAIWPAGEAFSPNAEDDTAPTPRGVAIAEGDPLPDHLLAELARRVASRDRRTDLIYGGTVR